MKFQSKLVFYVQFYRSEVIQIISHCPGLLINRVELYKDIVFHVVLYIMVVNIKIAIIAVRRIIKDCFCVKISCNQSL